MVEEFPAATDVTDGEVLLAAEVRIQESWVGTDRGTAVEKETCAFTAFDTAESHGPGDVVRESHSKVADGRCAEPFGSSAGADAESSGAIEESAREIHATDVGAIQSIDAQLSGFVTAASRAQEILEGNICEKEVGAAVTGIITDRSAGGFIRASAEVRRGVVVDDGLS